VGLLTLAASETALVALLWGNKVPHGYEMTAGENEVLRLAETQLKEYFAGERITFDVPLAPRGTEFQQRVWQELRNIPHGEFITYGEQARRLGRPKAFRAVGAANGKNPISILVPCHRVLGASGSLTGFAGGLETKRKLLELEGAKWEA
jgi:methylated-DNA-[protein]-cysteine S-methyltransferase